MEPQNIQILIEKYLSGTASSEEINSVEEFYASFEKNQGLTEQLNKEEVEATLSRTFSFIKSALKV